MAEVTATNYLKPKSAASTKRKPHKYNHRPHVVREHGRNLCIALEPQIVDKFGLLPDLDISNQVIVGNELRVTFRRRGGLEA